MFTSQNIRTRTTAPVVKHVCLFTRDLKRKHKRWQDGRLEFHTFNRRVMVYDENGTFIGDSHRMKDGDVEDGNEFQLDRGNVIVQVAELIGQREQDITEIVTRKPKPQESPAQSPASLLTPRTKPLSSHSQLRHLPLQSLLSTPGRQIGRAVIPTTSPYEQRNQTPDDAERLLKRRRIETNRAESHSARAVPRSAPPSLPQQPTTPVPHVPRNPPMRRSFSPPRMRKPDQASVNTHKVTTPGGPALSEPNPARSERIDLTSASPSSQKPLPSDDHALDAQRNQPVDVPSCRPKNTPIHNAPARKRNLALGKETREAVQRKGEEVLAGGKSAAASDLSSKVAHVNRADNPKQADEPTTALRLGSAQRRGLLVAKRPPSRPQRRDRIPAQPVDNGRQVNPEAMADADFSPEITPGRNTERREPAQPGEETIQINPEVVADTESPSEIISTRDTEQQEPDLTREPRSKPQRRDSIPAQCADRRMQANPEVLANADPSPETIPMKDMGQREPDPRLPADTPAPLPIDTPASEGGKPVVVVVKPSTETPTGGGAWSREADDLLDYKRGRRDGKSAK